MGQAFLRNFDEDFFVLNAKQFDLGHVFHTQQLLPNLVGLDSHFGRAEAIRRQGINDAIDVAKVIVEKRPLHALRQGVAHVANFFAHLVPNISHIRGFGRVLDLKNDLRFARLGVAADLVGIRRFLQGVWCDLRPVFGRLQSGRNED